MNKNKNFILKEPKHILIISYVFPPYPGIGGRRWAKFAKYLAKKGYVVHVICSENPLKQTSLFNKDIVHPNIHVHPLPPNYPSVLVDDVRSVMDKISYRLNLLLLKLKVKGNYYDRGVLWKDQLVNASSRLIREHGIKDVVVTGAPFSLLDHAIALKKIFNKIRLIADLRDPWTWGSGYGMSIISEKRQNTEKGMETLVMKNYHRVFVPSEEMKSHLMKEYSSEASKVTLLPHAFDKDEINVVKPQSSDKIKILLYGTLYDKGENIYSELAKVIVSHQDLHLDVYSSSSRYSACFQIKGLLKKQVNYHQALPPDQLFSKFDQYNAVLIIQPDFALDHITTKIYEIIYSGLPLILISKPGKLSAFITENKLGKHILPENIGKELYAASAKPEAIGSGFSIDRFSFDSVTETLSDQLSAE